MTTPAQSPFQPLKAEDPPVVGGYRLAAVLGAGGMGKVYLSYTPGGRPLALKVIRPEFSEDPDFRRRFEQEVHAAQRVQGLYTAPVIDCDTQANPPWLATAYVPGPSLAHAVAQHGALPVRSTLLLAVGVAEALQVIHGAGIVHRDLKPGNVLLASDGPRVIDFGIARAADATSLTSSGVTVGTPAFMAPEQAMSGVVSPATDIFALGQIMAFAAIGAPAYGDGPSHAVLYRIVHEDPDLSRLPDTLRPLVSACLSRDPADRPSSAEVIERCHEVASSPLRQGEDWLPQSFATALVDRSEMPAPVQTPPPTSGAATPPPVAGAVPYPPTQAAGTPPPGAGHVSHAPTQASATPPPVAGAVPHPPTTAAPHTGPSPYAPTAFSQTPPPVPHGMHPQHAQHPQYRTPVVGHHGPMGAPHPGVGPRPWGAVPPPPKKRTGLIVALSVIGGLFVLGVIGALLPDGGSGDSSSSTSSGTSGSAGSAKGGGQKRPDPKPASYKNINLTGDYYLQLADNPPKPIDGGDTGAMYAGGDFYFSFDSTGISDPKVGTDNGKLVLLNNAEKGSLKTCRDETRFTDKINLDQLSNGSQICVRSDAGHIGVVTYRGRSGANSPSTYITLDLTVWRNAEEATEQD
ncbi:serine/threonine-protein kinase [Streptomyces sp. VRA16 Mangrove soil]|uniref:serine/threonine protein kinase n=1 Tax=Streptomyces sp. VRA16 Mangrove soil TaxID=2817434 RepID=UPI001A9FF81A|nr:serine/threonine-protein kinase [Streptomyces sp. VRA16 Mangrove soil]MBO1332814.1 protein kinase [Streptomyces sp. VRA16 Mangrove soil]